MTTQPPEPDTSSSPNGSPPAVWDRVSEHSERWERPGFGAVEARGPELWAILPVCGHSSYGALTLIEAQRHLDEHQGLCFVCWYRTYAVRRALGGGNPMLPDEPPF